MSKNISPVITELLLNAKAKALGTVGSNGLNVVPVSMTTVDGETIWLFDFFMDKTVKNLQQENSVVLTVWSDMKGVQIKGDVHYWTEGDIFERAVKFVHEANPTRVLKGLIVLAPKQIFDISPGGAFAADDLRLY